ncbi:MAG: alcohol dehydrogenase catalytic domain-containing protein [Chloroflexi bacterium]|jgi:threonine dehydrogenase-like Zn-dependent dehydrogenase|nr:alcohol dehydrogenase catalytic domain-containing protein [Chloroflexota bacterium]
MNHDQLYADPKLAAFKRGDAAVPARYWLWPLYGAGLESLGLDDKPIQVDTPTCGPDELLVRHDAVGLCFSDIKVIKAGETHPRLTGRDMKKNPVVLGHEVALTVIQVGENRKDQFKPGDRFIVQADIYYKGQGIAYGYALQGGLSQFNIIGKELLEGDEGCYLLPVQPETGYAQAALTEPWACVTASYDVKYRAGWKPGGVVVIAAGPGNREDYVLGMPPYDGGQPPAQIITLGVSAALANELRQRAASDGFKLTELGAPDANTLAEALQAAGQAGFDDIVMLGPDVALYELLEPAANKSCILNIVGAQALEGTAQVDVGRLHYDNLSLVGTDGDMIAMAYEPVRTELKAGGKAAFIGAAGPMGQMHVQRVLEAAEPPRLAVATDLIPERLEVTRTKYTQLIEARRNEIQLELRTPEGKSPAEFNASLVEMTGGAGFDDIVVLAPSAGVVAGAVPMLAANGVMNIFAGLSRGTKAPIDLSAVANKGVRFTGTSGSAIRDLRNMLTAAESGQLNPNLSVAAVSGMMGVKHGLEGVVNQTFPGKVVIYPQILDFPVTTLEELEHVLPNVYAKLGPNHSWTVEAEAEFLKELLP